jgi:Lon protease-like protein
MTWNPSERLPLFPLGTALVPGMDLPLHIFEERYRRLMRDRIGREPVFGVVLISAGREVADHPEIHRIGTAATLIDSTEHPDGRYSILVRGARRFRVLDEDWSNAYLTAAIEWLDESPGDVDRLPELSQQATERWRKFVIALARLVGDRDEVDTIAEQIVSRLPSDPTERCYEIIGQLPVPAATRQRLIEVDTTELRLCELLNLLEVERRLMTALGTTPTLAYATNRSLGSN